MSMQSAKVVRELRHTLLWPITLRPLRRERGAEELHYWDVLKSNPGAWKYVDDPLLIDDAACIAGYEEFVYFLPYVQRFLYGVGDEGQGAHASLHVFRRDDIATARVELDSGDKLDLYVERARLYFFYDIDVALAVLDVSARDVPLAAAVELMDRFGRPYPPGWAGAETAAHCLKSVELLGADGAQLSRSDYGDREKYVGLVRDQRQTPLSRHWEYLLSPLVPAYLPGGLIKYYQIENKRIPILTYLSFDDPRELTRGDTARIAFAAKWGESDTLPYSASFLRNFENEYCYDRYWDAEDAGSGMNTRYLFCGLAFAAVTRHDAQGRALLSQFRHQFFQIGLIAHFHKASLLSLSNRFSRAVERLDVRDFESVKAFKKHVRETLEVFLRFNHRYWFHEISNQVQASEFFTRLSHQLGSDALYAEVREEARDINEYLDADRMRKQTDNAMRLTVVSACGMVGTVVTGFLGMNLYAHADLPTLDKFIIFLVVFVPTVALGVYTVAISKRLANFMEALSSEGLTWREKLSTFRQIWGVEPASTPRRRGGDVTLSGEESA